MALGCTVAELQDRMGYSEFVEWQAFYEAEPFGESRSDIQTALLAATIANANRSKKSKVAKVSDFLIDWWHDKSKPHALLAKFRAATKTEKPKANGSRSRNTRRRAHRRDGQI